MSRAVTPEQKERARARAKAWHWANRDRALQTSRAWAQRHREVARERTLRWRAENPERARANDAKKRANRSAEYLEKRRIDEQNRRARIKANGGRLSKGLATRLLEKQRGLCVYCAGSIAEAFHMDHIMPIALGGPNEDENIQLLCPPCNRRKHSKHPNEFKR